MSLPAPITVTSPLLPGLDDFRRLLEDIWQRRWITNNGHYHHLLETALADYLGVGCLSLFTNGTLPLITALQALGLRSGEVVTTPYSFVATTHALWWNGLTPVFADVDATTGNLAPDAVEACITSRTVAIMPVHVYGNPVDVQTMQKVADKYGLKVIYDAAHAFGVRVGGKSILDAGDVSTLSFHATKVYNTVEGGALVCKNSDMKQHIDNLKNFGFTGEISVEEQGINSKLDELRAAYGLLNLQSVDASIRARRKVALYYRQAFADVPGVRCMQDIPGVHHNYAYFPIFIESKELGMSRDALYEKLKRNGILSRRYFYPLIPDFSCYADTLSAKAAYIPVARRLASEVLCLPIHHALSDADLERITQVLIPS